MTNVRVLASCILLAACAGAPSRNGNTGTGGSDEGGAPGSGGKGGATNTGGANANTGGANTGSGGDTGGGGSTGGRPGDAGPVSCSSADAGTPTGDVTAPGTAAKARPFLKPRPKDTAAQPWVDKLTEAQWLAIVPRQSPRVPDWGGCHPAGSTGYKWDPLDPDHITYVDAAGATVLVLPNATDGHTTIPVGVLSGKTVQVPVWTVNGATCYAQETIDYAKSQFLFDRLEELAAAYDSATTRKEVYARRIALALDAWADYLPDYFLTMQNSPRPIEVAEAEAKKYTVVQRMSDHNGIGHELDRGVVVALDAAYDSQAMKDLSAERKYDVRKKIVDNFFGNHVDYLLKKIPITTHVATNLSGTPEQLGNLAIVLGRADWIAWLDEYMQLTVDHLLRDGMDGESFSYCWGYLTANRATTVEMAGYFDIWPPVNDAQRAVQAAADKYNDLVQKGIDAIASVREPDGTVPPFGNTNFNGGGAARMQSRSTLLPAYGHLTLADGTGANQTQVNLNFVDNANHDEQDVLTFTLFGAASEVLSDLRYSRMPGRPFTESTMAHNTVTIDRKDQFRSTNQDTGNRGHLFTGGDLLLFEPNQAGISVAEVDGARAYQNVAGTRYQRLQILNTIDPTQPYLVDLFRVRGGGTHDYFLHGPTRFDSVTPPPDKTKPAGTSSLPLALIDKPYPLLEGTETFVEPPQDSEPWYGAFRDVWTARSNGNWNVTFKATAGTQAVRITMLDDADVDVFVGKSPAPFRDKMPADNPQAFYGYWRPSLMVRHRAPAVDSLFVSVIEPFSGAPAVTSVERLPLSVKDKDHVALRIKLKSGREDVVLIDLANPAITGQPSPGRFATADGKYALTGRVGVAPSQGKAVLIAGTRFEYAGKSLAGDAALTGTIARVMRAEEGCSANAFVTDAALPEGDALKGRWIMLTMGTYKVIPSGTSYPLGVMEQKGIRQPFQIERVQKMGGQTYVVLTADPMLAMGGGKVTETTRPGRTFEGAVSFEIPLAAASQ